ncbi:hypothetical protein [Bacillus sp. ISL-45]|uniref:hypothetical protein n=1 Tax=Bacillus sp. ISL-45 TaxID=2819128 RepID=UPI001BE9D661|nr:hypothetical protein [Bacillus sp. ISL-45]MBT2663876.1 hypothetical protein [Bacillus sp. ISL-45]
MGKRIIGPDIKKELLKDLKVVKSILTKYESILNSKEHESEKLPTLRDIMNTEEKIKVDSLKVELLHAWSDYERNQILLEIENIFEEAKHRYYLSLRE